MKAGALREQALGALLKAKALVDDEGNIKAEDQEAFTAHMAEFSALDAKAQAAQTSEDQVGTLRERLEWYTGKATGQPMHFQQTVLDPTAGKSLGRQFVESPAYAELKKSGALASDSSFKSMPFIGSHRGMAAATDIVSTGGGPASGLITPQYLPGIVPLPSRPLTIRDLFGQGTATSDIVSYAQQTLREGAAAAVAQAQSASGSGASGGVKPQASAKWERKTSPVENIAVWMATTRTALADEGQVESLIENQLRILMGLEEEEQLLNGNGTSPNLSGIFDQPDIQTLSASAIYADDNLDAVRGARRRVKTGLSRLTADGIVVNPVDSEGFDLLKDEMGQYRGGNPIGNFSFDLPIWSLRRVESEAIAEGHALVGAFKAGATVLERQPITILTADQHADFFVRNLVVILAEERLGFPVFFPTAFLDLSLATWPTPAS